MARWLDSVTFFFVVVEARYCTKLQMASRSLLSCLHSFFHGPGPPCPAGHTRLPYTGMPEFCTPLFFFFFFSCFLGGPCSTHADIYTFTARKHSRILFLFKYSLFSPTTRSVFMQHSFIYACSTRLLQAQKIFLAQGFSFLPLSLAQRRELRPVSSLSLSFSL